MIDSPNVARARCHDARGCLRRGPDVTARLGIHRRRTRRKARRKTESWTTSGFLTPKHAPTHPRTRMHTRWQPTARHDTWQERHVGKSRGEERRGGGRKAKTDVSDISKTNSYIHAPLSHTRHTCNQHTRNVEKDAIHTRTRGGVPTAVAHLTRRRRKGRPERGRERERRAIVGDERDWQSKIHSS